MTANISIQATLNNTANFFVVSWALASGGGIINSISPTKPYGNPWQVAIPNLTPNIVYIITLWESPDTTPQGTVRNATNYIPTATTTTLRADDYLVTDITPGLVNNTTAYVNASYIGWSYDVERVGQGTMFPQGATNVNSPDYAQDNSGGFHLLNTGDSFQPSEKFVVRFQPQVAPAEASSTGVFSTYETITASTVLTSSDLNKAIFIQGSGSYLNLTLPPLSSVSDTQFMYFYSAGGSHISAIFTCAGTDKIQNNIPIPSIVLCQNEQMKIFKANGVWNIDSISASVGMVGEVLYRYNTTIMNQYALNTVLADGSLLNRNTYWRLYLYLVNSGVPSVSEATWGQATVLDGVTFYLNKGNWTTGTDGTNFRVPDLRDYFIRGYVAGIATGTGMYDTFPIHKHNTAVGLLPGSPFGKGPSSSNGAKYGNPQAGQPDLTDVPYSNASAGTNGAPFQRVGTETAPKHVRIPILIRI